MLCFVGTGWTLLRNSLETPNLAHKAAHPILGLVLQVLSLLWLYTFGVALWSLNYIPLWPSLLSIPPDGEQAKRFDGNSNEEVGYAVGESLRIGVSVSVASVLFAGVVAFQEVTLRDVGVTAQVLALPLALVFLVIPMWVCLPVSDWLAPGLVESVGVQMRPLSGAESLLSGHHPGDRGTDVERAQLPAPEPAAPSVSPTASLSPTAAPGENLSIEPRRPLRHLQLLRRLLESFAFPAFGVTFAHVIAADILTSATWMLWDLEVSVCLLFSPQTWSLRPATEPHVCLARDNQNIAKPLLFMLPFVVRMGQCLFLASRGNDNRRGAHLLNAVKYLSSILVLLCSALSGSLTSRFGSDVFFFLYTALVTVKTVYSLVWDLVMDFGFWWAPGQPNPLLRDRLLFSSKWPYYIVILADCAGRCTWARAIGPQSQSYDWDLLYSLVELFRRGLWLVFRVEYEVGKKKQA